MNIVDIQNNLNSLGYHCGKADGVAGPKYKAAVMRFQFSWNLGPWIGVDGVAGSKETIPALVKTINSGGKISPNFRSIEFMCKCKGKYAGCGGIWVDRADVAGLETLRANAYKGGLSIVSACRCPRHNANVGGASKSRHVVGDAFDIPPVLTPGSRSIPSRFKGRGIHRSGKVSHIDSRDTNAKWNY